MHAALQAGLGVWPSLRQLNPQPSVAAREAQHSPTPLLPLSHSNRSSMGALSAAGGSQRTSQRAGGAGAWGDAESGVSGRSSRSASPTPLHSRSRTQLLPDGEADPRVFAGLGATHGSVGPGEERREQLGGPSGRRVGWTQDTPGGGAAGQQGLPGAGAGGAGGAVPPLLLGGGRDAAAALAAATAGMAFTNERQRQRMEPMLEMWHAAAGVDGEVRAGRGAVRGGAHGGWIYAADGDMVNPGNPSAQLRICIRLPYATALVLFEEVHMLSMSHVLDVSIRQPRCSSPRARAGHYL